MRESLKVFCDNELYDKLTNASAAIRERENLGMDRNRTRDDATFSAAPGNLTRRDTLAGLAGGLLMPSLATASSVARVPSSRMEIDDRLHYASLADVAKLIETGKLSPADLTRQLLDRIAAVDVSLHSYVTILADAAMEGARRAEIDIRADRYRPGCA